MTAEQAVVAPFAGTVIAIAHEPDEPVAPGTALVVLEAMKMEHEVIAQDGGVVRRVDVSVGDTVTEGQVLAILSPVPTAARAQRLRKRRPIPTSYGKISERSASATRSGSTRRGPTRSQSATSGGTGPPERTSTTSSTRGRSSSTAR